MSNSWTELNEGLTDGDDFDERDCHDELNGLHEGGERQDGNDNWTGERVDDEPALSCIYDEEWRDEISESDYEDEAEDINPADEASNYDWRGSWFDEIDDAALLKDLPEEAFRELQRADDEAAKTQRLSELMERKGVRLRRSANGGGIANCPSRAHKLRSASLQVKDLEEDHFICSVCGASGGGKISSGSFMAHRSYR